MIKLLFCAVAIISISSGYNDYEDYKYKLGKGVALTHAADYLSERSPLLAKRYIGRPAMYGHGLSGYYGGRIAGLGEKYGLMHGASYGYPRYGGIGGGYGSMYKGAYGYPRYGGLGGGYGSMYKGAYGYPSRFHHHMHCPHSNSMYDHELANFMYRTSISAFELGFQVAHGLLQNYICFHTIKI
ncbi:hypothetical protein GJ496_005703 [Pomphorhynchus laevis]|nr:hypothetical protein GJ496_005703 [Pomphorhynchus laevis]